MEDRRRLIIFRHGKAESGSAGTADFDRSLTDSGREDARLMGRYVFDRQPHIDLIMCSPARRTRETLDSFRSVLYPGVAVDFCDELYQLLSVDSLMSLLSGIDDSVQSLMLVGHNPVFADYLYRVSSLPVNVNNVAGNTQWSRTVTKFSPGSSAMMLGGNDWDSFGNSAVEIMFCERPVNIRGSSEHEPF